MARWRLVVNHYMNTADGTKWEYTEIDRLTGRPKRTQYPVPRYLDINDPMDWTERTPDGLGFVNVTDGVGGLPSDVVFYGQPTPDMMPLDDDARTKSGSLAKIWKRPLEDAIIDGPSYADTVVESLHTQMAKLQEAAASPQPAPGIAEALAMMTEIMKQNQQMMAELVKSGNGGRRI